MPVQDSPSLPELLRRPDIWQGFRSDSIGNRRTGHPLLDRQLPGRGWPEAGMIELLHSAAGIGELQLVAPSLKNTRQCWVAPPLLPYAPALAQTGIDPRALLIVQPDNPTDSLWALEQVLQAGSEEVVLGWCAQASMAALRRLQLAAETHQTRLFLFRPAHFHQQPSPAPLRLYLRAAQGGLHLRILKSRGGRPTDFVLPFNEQANTGAPAHFTPTQNNPTVLPQPHVVAGSEPTAAPAARPRPRAA